MVRGVVGLRLVGGELGLEALSHSNKLFYHPPWLRLEHLMSIPIYVLGIYMTHSIG